MQWANCSSLNQHEKADEWKHDGTHGAKGKAGSPIGGSRSDVGDEHD